MSSREFVLWCVDEDARMNEPTVDQLYLAQIASMIYKSIPSKNKKRYKDADFQLKFKRPRKLTKKEKKRLARIAADRIIALFAGATIVDKRKKK